MSIKQLVILVALVALGAGVAFTTSDPLSNYGGEGESCYPNRTCEEPNTCFRFRDTLQCERNVAPALLTDTKYCYTFKTDNSVQEKCASNEVDCLANYNLLPADREVIQVCAKKVIDPSQPSQTRTFVGRKLAEVKEDGTVVMETPPTTETPPAAPAPTE